MSGLQPTGPVAPAHDKSGLWILPTATPPGFEQIYTDEARELMVIRLRLALSVGLFLYGSFIVLDWLSHPNHWLTFAGMRLTVVGLSVVTIKATHTDWGQRHIQLLSMSILLLAALGISVMTTMLGGFGSDYYIGNMLVLFFVGLFMPWPLWASILFASLLCGPYFLLNGWIDGASQAVLSPFFFLLGTSCFTCFATIAGDRSRRRDLSLRIEVEEANAHLLELDEAKSRFFANVSHELRTPLMLITGPLGELMDKEQDPATRARLDSMAANADRLIRHVNMILDFARVDGGQMQARAAVGNVGTLLQELIRAALPHAQSLGLDLKTDGLDRVPNSLFDLDQIETLGANLLSNAIKFTPGGGTIHIRARADKGSVIFEVEDTGRGIPDDELEKIFNRFHQVDGGKAGKNKGTGLGLALCRELAQLHGGSLRVDSALGYGSTFVVTLPRRPDSALEQGSAELVDEVAVASQPRIGRLLADIRQTSKVGAAVLPTCAEDAPVILVVEDNDDLRDFVVRSLSGDFRIKTAADGREGLEASRQHRPDLIVSDIMMPRMTGIEMVRELAADPALRQIPVVLLSALVDTDSVIEGLEGGAVDYITKPFQIRELRARIDAHLRARGLEQQLDERETRLAAVGQMTAGIAHDLRGPLTAIVGHTEIAQMLGDGMPGFDELSEDLDAIECASRRAVRMIEELVAYAREGTLSLYREDTDLAAFVEDIGQSLRCTLAPMGIELKVASDGDDDHLSLPVDRDRLQRVLENLVGNARDAIATRTIVGGRIEVSVAAKPDGVRIRIADNGPGVDPDVADRLFNPFVTSGKSGGTGLGLAISKNLVAAHGGTIGLDPSTTSGAAFTVTLPRPTTA
ncbi:MAG: signal transduction histidine kinase [Myxococcota bacterium]|jgi:signal transduction histidine kinase